MGNNFTDRLFARAISLAVKMDRFGAAYKRYRNEMILCLASDSVLRRYNDLVYSGAKSYDPSSVFFREDLFDWEAYVVDRFFPKPGAHVLVGAAGGGREVFELARRGYRITAFDACEQLARACSLKAEASGLPIEVYLGKFEDLWTRVLVQDKKDLRQLPLAKQLPEFDAIVIGWGGYSHLLNEGDRVSLLAALRERLVDGGIILVSYLARNQNENVVSRHSALEQQTKALKALRKRSDQDQFLGNTGYAHYFDKSEMQRLVSKAGLEICYSALDTEQYPHLVLRK